MTVYLVFPLGLAIFSARYLLKGGMFKITPDRAVNESLGRPLAMLLLIGAAIDAITILFFRSIVFASVIALLAAMIIGLIAAQKIEP